MILGGNLTCGGGRVAVSRATTVITRCRYYLRDALVVEHAPGTGSTRGPAVVILPPLGYEDTSAYRPLRVLADALAERGFVACRLDWPGLGDSAGSALDVDLVDRQLAAARALAGSLRERGAASVCGVGVRAGGLLALEAACFDRLVLWGTPASGKAYLREERAFHRLAARAFSEAPAGAPSLPAGAVEAGGFVHGAETVARLDQLDPTALAARPLSAVLVLEREGTATRGEVLEALRAFTADLTVLDAGGVGDLLDDPYRASLSPRAREAILAWLCRDTNTGKIDPPPATNSLRLGNVVERPWVGQGDGGELVGILCQPTELAPGAPWTVFYNAGGVRRSGPNRLWTAAARELAAAGIPSLRVDVRDVGDSDGASLPFRDLEAMYSEGSVADAVAAYDAVRDLGAGPVDVVGLCSGAFMAVQVASRRPVRRATIFNCLAYVWNDDARSNGYTAQVARSLFDARRWQRLLTGRIDAVALAGAMFTRARLRLLSLGQRLRGAPVDDEVAALLRLVVARGTALSVVCSEGDPSVDYLNQHVLVHDRPPVTIIPGVDHTIRPAWAHAEVIRLITTPPPGGEHVD